jgi:hypothetical protein
VEGPLRLAGESGLSLAHTLSSELATYLATHRSSIRRLRRWCTCKFILGEDSSASLIWCRAHLVRKPTVIDAERIEDNLPVFLKRVQRLDSTERETTAALTTGFASADPQNHCMPIHTSLKFPHLGLEILVFSRFRQWDNPNFETIGEAVNFFEQIFEVQFLPFAILIAITKSKICLGTCVHASTRPCTPVRCLLAYAPPITHACFTVTLISELALLTADLMFILAQTQHHDGRSSNVSGWMASYQDGQTERGSEDYTSRQAPQP